MTEQTFRTKYDAWLVAVLVVSLGYALAVAVVAAVMGHLLWALPTLGVLAFVGWTANTTYTFAGGELVVRAGPFRWRIPLAGITRVEATGNPLSSPAWSLDRLAIEYRRPDGRERALMISPKEKAAFLAALAARCPAARIEA